MDKNQTTQEKTFTGWKLSWNPGSGILKAKNVCVSRMSRVECFSQAGQKYRNVKYRDSPALSSCSSFQAGVKRD